MATKVKVNFEPMKILENKGYPHGARKFLANEVLTMSDPYAPFDKGTLKNSATIATDGSYIKYNAPYARALWYGEIMVDPKTGIGGIPTNNGFISRKGVKKIKASESPERLAKGLPIHYNFKGGPTRGSRWVERAVNTNRKQLINAMQNAADRGLFK